MSEENNRSYFLFGNEVGAVGNTLGIHTGEAIAAKKAQPLNADILGHKYTADDIDDINENLAKLQIFTINGTSATAKDGWTTFSYPSGCTIDNCIVFAQIFIDDIWTSQYSGLNAIQVTQENSFIRIIVRNSSVVNRPLRVIVQRFS